MVAETQTGSIRDFPAYLHFTPRPDQPDKFDEQTSFYNCDSDGCIFLTGGNGAGCLAAEQLVYDPVKAVSLPVSHITEDFHVIARNSHGNAVIAKAEKPRIYGTEDIYDVTLSNGKTMRVTLAHRVLTPGGWKEIGRAISEQEVIGSDDSMIISGDSLVYGLRCDFVRRDTYWDFHVPEYENYWMAGVWNHNTTSCLIAKICRFVLETPPPRRDTPFWVIAETYEQIGSMFDEKFNQQGHLPASVIDWPRIHWNNRNNNQPFRVPLKSPPGHTGRNWSLEFKSWRQGRGKMQARSLGGFGFIEQFPWGIFEEVLRGCREYNFPGSKLVEFTPVDADLSQNLEEMIENGYEPENPAPGLSYLPKNWKIFHANTLCAMEAGHVDKRWFEEFFGMVPKDMLETRLKGMFSTFEGVIYKDFNVGTHCMGDEMWARIKNCYHRRGIDWGAGPENDFVCEWGAKNGLGQWFIYDEEVSNDQSKTTVDHLTDVYHRWEWPDDNPMYGVTYADPSSPDNIRIAGKLNQYNPAVENLSMQRGRNSVLEGIEHIQYLLKPQIPVPMVDAQGKPIIDPETGKCAIKLEPKLFIHRTNCPKLIQQMKSYRWLRGSDPTMKLSRNPRDPLRAPLKKNDHCADALRYICFSDDFMTGSTISSAKNHSALTAQLHGEYIPRQGLRGFTTQHRERG